MKLLKNTKRRWFEQTRNPLNCCSIAIYRQKECDFRRALSLGGPRLPRQNNATTGEAADAKEQPTDFKIRRRWTTPKKKPKVHVKVPRIQTFHLLFFFFTIFLRFFVEPFAALRPRNVLSFVIFASKVHFWLIVAIIPLEMMFLKTLIIFYIFKKFFSLKMCQVPPGGLEVIR